VATLSPAGSLLLASYQAMRTIRSVHSQRLLMEGFDRTAITGDCGTTGWTMRISGVDNTTGRPQVIDVIATGEGFKGHIWVRGREGHGPWSPWQELTGDALLGLSFFLGGLCPQDDPNGLALPSSAGATILDLGPATVGGRRAEDLRAQSTDTSARVDIYIDQQTHYVLRIVGVEASSKSTTYTQYSNFDEPVAIRPPAGISVPTATPSATTTATPVPVATSGQPAGESGISFRRDIQPIFAAHCAACHIGNRLGGLDLGTYQGLINGGSVFPGSIVTPGHHAKSILWQIVQPNAPWPGGVRMPLGGPYLSEAEIRSIATWIDQGATNN
jgi:hypothetical protein